MSCFLSFWKHSRRAQQSRTSSLRVEPLQSFGGILVVRLEFKRLAEIGDGLLAIALGLEDFCAECVSGGIVGIEGQRGVEIGQCLLMLAEIGVGSAAVEERIELRGIKPYRLGEVG